MRNSYLFALPSEKLRKMSSKLKKETKREEIWRGQTKLAAQL
jgi:hypothetical protein